MQVSEALRERRRAVELRRALSPAVTHTHGRMGRLELRHNAVVRSWSAVPLLLLSCTRPNPAFAVGGETLGDASTGTSVTGDTPTGTSSEPTTASTDEPDPVTDSVSGSTTGVPDTTGTTGPELPTCGPLPTAKIQFDTPLPQSECQKLLTGFVMITKPADAATAVLCTGLDCTGFCTPPFALGPDLSSLVQDGKCLTVKHKGAWRPDDPESPLGCKTTAVAVFDVGLVHPLYAGFSNEVQPPPGLLDPAVALSVERGEGERCACDQGDCCPEGQAARHSLSFSHDGAALAVLAPGDAPGVVELSGVPYGLQVLRAHTAGHVDAQQMCVVDPARTFVDWHMLRLAPP